MDDKPIATVQQFNDAFWAECQQEYPAVDAFMKANKLQDPEVIPFLDAAGTLACPVKANPPCWQHGRLVYGLALEALSGVGRKEAAVLIDVGTAKGFSALMMQWAIDNSMKRGRVYSVDVIDPDDRVRRNTVTEAKLGRYLTLGEILLPWIEARKINFYGGGSDAFFKLPEISVLPRVHFAFIDGKHTYESAAGAAIAISKKQQSGDVMLFDDVHMIEVRRAFVNTQALYDLETVVALPQRAYGIARRR